MNKELKSNSIIFSLFFVLILNTGMIEKSQIKTHSDVQTNIQFSPNKQSVKKKSKLKSRKSKHFFKKQIVDEGALLLAVLAVAVAGVAVYFFFTIGFFTGVISLMIAAFLLYFLFRYLEY